ncbi:NAD-dependent epimerase/dehydratase family protein [Trinickia sp. EG282A]|uniref:NAD-dependent epimerase/dehydratase family protein n=1 Tax=Trinickia sp. EG282A TaxID=3237013 RepID=UPI0034D25800
MARTQYTSLIAEDLAPLVGSSESLWAELDGAHVLITGGTGFVGCWLLEAVLWARSHHQVDVRIDVLARRPERLYIVAPHIAADPSVRLVRGDIRTGDLPSGAQAHAINGDRSGRVASAYTHVIHAATETNVALDNPPPFDVFDASLTGTRHVLELCRRDAVRRFLLVSSGAVYGRNHSLGRPVNEDDPIAGVRGDIAGAYALGKATAEFLGISFGAEYGFAAVAARCFSFVGPYLPLDSGFAVGNFIRDSLEGRSIVVNGDGTPVRAYLYGADMALWLWTMLLRGQRGDIYNVGSDRSLSIRELAMQVARVVADELASREKPVIVRARPTGYSAELFVPDIRRARERLALEVRTPLDEAIRRTARWALAASRNARQRTRAYSALACPADLKLRG